MRRTKVIGGIAFFVLLFIFLFNIKEVRAATYSGTIVAIEGNAMQVKGSNGKVSVFWMGHRPHFNPRAP